MIGEIWEDMEGGGRGGGKREKILHFRQKIKGKEERKLIQFYKSSYTPFPQFDI